MERDLKRVNVKSTDGVLIGHFNSCPAHLVNREQFVTLRLVVHPTARVPFRIVSSDPVPTIELNDPQNYDGFTLLAPRRDLEPRHSG
jgi:hypothetical protein